MRFMMIVKHVENQGPPPKPLMDALAKLAEESTNTGTMLGSGGLGPTAQGARVRLRGGQVTVTDGPFTEAKEVVGGYAQFELKSKQEAVESAVHFMELHKKYGRAGRARPRFVRCSTRNTSLPSRRSGTTISVRAKQYSYHETAARSVTLLR
jgi:hypothetical protein